jgi:oligosaccharide repeat unit polymerase
MSMAGNGRTLWWLSPVGAVALVVPGTLLLASRMSDSAFRDSYRTPKSLTSSTVTLLFVGALVFMFGAMLPLLRRATETRSRPFALDDGQRRRLKRVETALFWLTVAGYAAFVVSSIKNGTTLSQILQVVAEQRNDTGNLKAQSASITGITTLTQVGIAYVVVALVLLDGHPDRRLRRRLALVFGLGLVRAFLLTERLAILELLVPAAALLAMRAGRSGGSKARWAARLAPLYAIPAVVVVFGLFEYSRSWVYYSTHTSQSFTWFTISRLAGYYVTAYNNGQLSLTYETYPGRIPYSSLEALWTAPGIKQLDGYALLSGHDTAQQYTDAVLLQQHGNPEFNSPSGLAIPFVDYGTAGGLLFLLAAGVVLGLAYRGVRDGRLTAVFIYPVLATGLFELPRYLYWTQGRTAPSLVALGATGWWLQRHAKRSHGSALYRDGPDGYSIATPPSPLPTTGAQERPDASSDAAGARVHLPGSAKVGEACADVPAAAPAHERLFRSTAPPAR